MIKRVILILIGLLLLGYIGYTAWQRPALPHGAQPCRGVEVSLHIPEGTAAFMSEADVLREIERMQIKTEGTPLEQIDVYQIEQKLKENPIFSTAEVYLSTSTQFLHVDLEQKEALYLVLPDGEHPYYVTRERGFIPAQPNYTIYVPVVSGRVKLADALGRIYDLEECLRQDPDYRDYFGQCYVDRDGAITLVPRALGPKILLGHSTQWQGMLDKLRAFEREVSGRRGRNAFEYLKLQFEGQVVAKSRFTPEKSPEANI